MDRAEATGLGVALAGHGLLLAVLSVGFATATKQPLLSQPMEVAFVEEVGEISAAPDPATEAPAPSAAPDFGPPEEAAPAPVTLPQPEPLPAPPQPAAAPPRPQPKALPKTPLAAAKPAPAKPTPPKAAPAAKPAPVPAKPAAAGSGAAQQTRGSRLDRDLLKGLSADPSPSTEEKRPAAVMSPVALASIRSAIQRQIQPCANRQVDPGPGANDIVVTLNLRLNPDGSLAAPPRKVRTSGVNDGNSRYEQRVVDLAINAYTSCSPLQGLPEDLYRTPSGGWSNINMNYKLP